MLSKQRILRWWTYFRRGHSTYLAFLLSFANFVVIQYRLLVEHIPAMKVLFSSLMAFATTFFLVYIPLVILIGWYDYRRFAVPIETSISARASPWHRDIARAIMLIAEGIELEAYRVVDEVLRDIRRKLEAVAFKHIRNEINMVLPKVYQ